MANRPRRTIYANDATESVGFLLKLRLPWLIIGLIAGGLTTIAVSRFEHILQSEVRLAFFIPLIVYMSGAVGTQTETIFVRNASKGRLRAKSLVKYAVKELFQGVALGAIFGVLVAIFAYSWLGSSSVAATVGTAMAASVACATLVGLAIPAILKQEHQDPALGAGPFTTVTQDFVSLMIYFAIATLLIV